MDTYAEPAAVSRAGVSVVTLDVSRAFFAYRRPAVAVTGAGAARGAGGYGAENAFTPGARVDGARVFILAMSVISAARASALRRAVAGELAALGVARAFPTAWRHFVPVAASDAARRAGR